MTLDSIAAIKVLFFKKNSFLKSVLSLIILSLILTIVGSAIVFLFFSKLNLNTQVINLFDIMSKQNTTSVITKIFAAVIPIVLYSITLIKLKKSEVK